MSLLRPPTKIRNDLKLSAMPTAGPVAVSVAHMEIDKENTAADFVVVNAKASASSVRGTAPVPRKPATAPATKIAPAAAPRKTAAPAVSRTVSVVTAARRPVSASTTSQPTTMAGVKRPAAAALPVAPSAAAGHAKKRPAWDIKGRLQEMEEAHVQLIERLGSSDQDVLTMKQKLDVSEDRVVQLEMFRQQLQHNVQAKEIEYTHISQNYEQLKSQLRAQASDHADELQRLQRRMQIDLDDARRTIDGLERTKATVEAELRLAHQENLALKVQVTQTQFAQQSTLLVSAEAEGRALRLQIQMLEEDGRAKGAKIQTVTELLEDANLKIQALEAKCYADETTRRKLHNTIMELKGNIRVFCRVRPPLGNEDNEGTALSHMMLRGDDSIEIVTKAESASGQATAKSYPFKFDRVFGPSAAQANVFEEISQLVQSALDGYRVCIFAYGQTGSGKTHTMEGPPQGLENDQTRGMIPRAVYQIFEQTQRLKDKGWEYKMEVTFVEIYNETIRDLLGSGEDDKKHEIKHNEKNGTTSVSDVRVASVTSANQIFMLLQKATENRAVGKTQMNERSSRSHSVFSLRLVGTNSLTEETCDGVLNLIDLAGSERLAQSGSTGERLKETQAINKSLSSLADVIMALANKDGHIPYRNSKLTYLLQNSLGGNCKTLMFVNVSPLAFNTQETLCSLRFAAKVNACDIGTARRVK